MNTGNKRLLAPVESPFDRALRGLCDAQNAVGEMEDAGLISPASAKLINSALNLAGDNIRAAQSCAEYTRGDAQADAADAAYSSLEVPIRSNGKSPFSRRPNMEDLWELSRSICELLPSGRIRR